MEKAATHKSKNILFRKLGSVILKGVLIVWDVPGEEFIIGLIGVHLG